MNNNNLWTNSGQRNTQPPYNYQPQQQPQSQTPNHQYNYQVHQVPNSVTRQDPVDQRYNTGGRPYAPDYKQKNKAMYNSSMNFTHNNQGLTGLSSFARQVNQPIVKEKHDEDKFLNTNNNEKYNNNFNKHPGTSSKDPRMASSAIFPNPGNPVEFNRFPAFNLGWNQNSQQSTSSNSSNQDSTKRNQNETPQERKQRQLMDIKRQLDQINKKMMSHADKNKNTNNDSNNTLNTNMNTNANTNTNTNTNTNNSQQYLRPQKPSGVSQSVIIQTNSNNTYNNTGFGFGYPQNKPSINQGLSIEQLYAHKKGQNQVEQKYKNNYPVNNPVQNSVSSNYPQKQYVPDKKIEPQISSTNYQPNSYKPLNSYQPSSSYQSPKNNTSTSNYLNNNNYTDSNINTNTSIYNNNDKYSPVVKPNSPTSNTYNNTNFNKSSDAVVENGNTGGFKKKNNTATYSPVQINKEVGVDMKKPVYNASTSPNTQQPQQFGLRKIDSIDYYQSKSAQQSLVKEVQFKLADFAVGKKMGKGQFGQVLLVRHKLTGWLCGLKVMEKKQIKQEDYVGQIARELSIQFYLQHRNIGSLYGYFQQVQFCCGGQLLQKLRGQRRMNQKDVSNIIKQVCEGVDYIHKQLIIHRDIKPENILFNFGIVKISDFGWAVYRGFGMRKTASGSPLYYPPEIVKGQSYDDKIDVWNIGMMTYECILGKIPFRVYTQMDLGRIVSDQITFPSWVDVTDEAKDFILKTMKKKGDQRMQIRQMLRHPFLTKNQQNQLSSSILEEFKKVLG